MKTIGLIGGMSWESTLEYYRIINETTKKKAGGFHSAPIILQSVDFHRIEELQRSGNWQALTKIMVEAAKTLEKAGAELLLICTNTMHLMAGDVQKSISIPLLHIADAAAHAVKKKKIARVGLLGTKFTMEQDFYRLRLHEKHGLDVIVPNTEGREKVHRIIYDELVLGKIRKESKAVFIGIIQELAERGAEGVVLGCTEIPLLVKQEDVSIPVFDTTRIHAEYAVLEAMKPGGPIEHHGE